MSRYFVTFEVNLFHINLFVNEIRLSHIMGKIYFTADLKLAII